MTDTGTQKKPLTARQVTAVESLLRTDSTRAASEDCGVPTRTLRRWLEQSHFSEALEAHQGDMLKRVSNALSRNGEKAVDVLAGEMSDSTSTPQARIRAASCILDNLRNYHELTDLSERISALEGSAT